jgi:hypothetical protein
MPTVFRIPAVRLSVFVVILGSIAVLAGCAAPASPVAPTYDPSVRVLTGVDAAGPMSVTLADGTQACGVFDVNGHGPKQVAFIDFPACTSEQIAVYCLSGDAQWVDDTVADLKIEGDQLTFTSNQDGTCGLFPVSP